MDDTDRTRPERLGPQDAVAGLALSDEAGWNQSHDDWVLFLTQGTVFGLRDEHARLIATAALLPYPPAAWISLVLVTATWRRRGLATRLIEACIAAAKHAGITPWLDATPAGAAVYGSMGFHATLSIQRFRLQRTTSAGLRAEADSSLRTKQSDFLSRDRITMGFDRSVLLNELCRRSGSRLYARDSALCLVRDGRKARQVGPLFADQASHATTLLADIVSRESGSLVIDVVDTNHDVIQGLTTSGWVIERPFQRMRFGGPASRDSGAAIAIAGPEFG
jgi:GNAT superfamily N-acetyltransferase